MRLASCARAAVWSPLLRPILRLRPFDPDDGTAVVSFVRSDEEAGLWASLDAAPPDAALLRRWHAEADVHPFTLLADEQPVGYGEIWIDRDEDEAELARIVIAHEWRGRGLGRELTRLLAVEAASHGLAETWLRVVPENAAAISCYRAAGFVRAADEEEASFNAGQPRTYVWMRASRL